MLDETVADHKQAPALPAGAATVVLEQCTQLLSGLPIAAATNLMVAIVTAIMLDKPSSTLSVWYWFLLQCVVQTGRLVLWKSYHHRTQSLTHAQALVCLQRLRLSSLLSGGTWSVLSFGVFAFDLTELTFISFITAGITGAAMASMSCDAVAATLFFYSALVPLTTRLFFFGGHLPTAMGMLGIFYLLYLTFTTRRVMNAFKKTQALQRYATQQANSLATSESRFRTMFENSPDPVWIIRGFVFFNCNHAAQNMLGYTGTKALLNVHPADLAPTTQPDGQYSARKIDHWIRRTYQTGLERFDWVCKRQDGTTLWTEVTMSTIVLDHETVIYCVWRDIQARKDAEQKIQFQVSHDPLTGINNRYALEQLLPDTLSVARQLNRGVAIGLMDLDNFKPINDAYGHEAGDRLLIELSQRMQRNLREADFLARLGGDEFVVVFNDIDTTKTLPHLEEIMLRLEQSIATPFELGNGHQARVGMSMGIAMYPQHGVEPDDLLRKADAALYVAKAQKRKRTHWWQLWSEQVLANTPPDLYVRTPNLFGMEAATRLQAAHAVISQLIAPFVDEALAVQVNDAVFARVWNRLTHQEFAHYRATLVEQLSTIFRPELQEDVLKHVAQESGWENAWMGLDVAECSNLLVNLQISMQDCISQLPWRINETMELQHLVNGRITFALRWQQKGHSSLHNQLQAVLVELQEHESEWMESGEFNVQLMNRLSLIKGIGGVAAGRPDSDNRYVTEYAAGNTRSYINDIETSGILLTFSADDLTHLPPTMRAWTCPGIHTAPNFWSDPGLIRLNALASKRGFKSVAAFAAFDRSGHATITYSMWGQFPGQFESSAIRLWLNALHNFVERALQSSEFSIAHPKPTSVANRSHFQALLFGSGLSMHMQPLVDMTTGAVSKVEARARLTDDDGRLISPAIFLPAYGAQELQRLYRHGLKQSLHWIQQWDRSGLQLDLTMNLPPIVLAHPQCIAWTREALQESGVRPQRLYLELLEQEDLSRTEVRLAALSGLNALGVKIVMDDLGAGHSSLLRLRTLPFRSVKIDQELVKQAHIDPDKTIPFIGALVDMAHGLGMQVVIEGVETIDLVEMARGLGADLGQGYAIARPMAPELVADWVKNWRWDLNTPFPQTALGKGALRYRQGIQ